MNIKSVEINRDERKSSWVYRSMKSSILESYSVPGTLIAEEEASLFFRVSRPMIREVFIKLSLDGLLDIVPQKGTYVSLIDMNVVSETLFARIVLESEILKIATKSFDRGRLFELHRNIYLQEHSDDILAIIDSDNEFHKILFEGCGHNHIWKMIENSQLQYDRLRILALKDNPAQAVVVEDHKAILQAIERSDTEAAHAAIVHHLDCISSTYTPTLTKYSSYFCNISSTF